MCVEGNRGLNQSFCVILIGLLLAGCAAQPKNPAFSVSADDADRVFDQMHAARKPLRRPLVVVGGLNDPFVAATWLDYELSRAIDDRRIITVSLPLYFTMDGCRDHVLAAVQKAVPAGDGVDVIGVSLGVTVARYAALPRENGPRLKIVRLFSVAGPNQGAQIATRWPVLFPIQGDVRPGSAFMQRMAAAPVDYEIIPYVRLGDDVVGLAATRSPRHGHHRVRPPPRSE